MNRMMTVNTILYSF